MRTRKENRPLSMALVRKNLSAVNNILSHPGWTIDNLQRLEAMFGKLHENVKNVLANALEEIDNKRKSDVKEEQTQNAA